MSYASALRLNRSRKWNRIWYFRGLEFREIFLIPTNPQALCLMSKQSNETGMVDAAKSWNDGKDIIMVTSNLWNRGIFPGSRLISTTSLIPYNNSRVGLSASLTTNSRESRLLNS